MTPYVTLFQNAPLAWPRIRLTAVFMVISTRDTRSFWKYEQKGKLPIFADKMESQNPWKPIAPKPTGPGRPPGESHIVGRRSNASTACIECRKRKTKVSAHLQNLFTFAKIIHSVSEIHPARPVAIEILTASVTRRLIIAGGSQLSARSSH